MRSAVGLFTLQLLDFIPSGWIPAKGFRELVIKNSGRTKHSVVQSLSFLFAAGMIEARHVDDGDGLRCEYRKRTP
jgi:hypothetical protein